MVILENIDIDMDFLENIDIDIDKRICQNINIDKISYQLEFGISNRAISTEYLTSPGYFNPSLQL